MDEPKDEFMVEKSVQYLVGANRNGVKAMKRFWTLTCKIGLGIIVLSISIVACSNGGMVIPKSPSIPEKTVIPISTISGPTITSTIPVARVSLPSITPTVAPSFTPSPSSTVPASTATPTLSPQQIQDRVLSLLESNGNCVFPCWWGLTPGKTSFEIVNNLLEPLNTEKPPAYSGNMWKGATLYYYMPLPKDLSVQGRLDVRINFEKEVLRYIKVSEAEWPDYRLPALLDKYGPPGEVWLYTYTSQVELNPPFALYLYYPEKGILAYIPSRHPEKGDVQVQDGIIRGCVPYSATLFLWSPSEIQSIAEIGKRFVVEGLSSQENNTILPLQKTTGMDISSFYQRYKDPNQRPCLETPADLWPTF